MKFPKLTAQRTALLAIFFSLTAVITFVYVRQVELAALDNRIRMHQRILSGVADSPYNYRLLVPWLTEGLTQLLSRVLSYDFSFMLAYAIYDAIVLFFIFYFLYDYLVVFFKPVHALLGVLFVGCTIPIALRDHLYQPWSLIETLFFCLGLLLIQRKQNLALAGLILVASFNRETGIFLILVFVFTQVDLRQMWMKKRFIGSKEMGWSIAYSLIWAIIFLGLRFFIPDTQPVHTITELFALNLQPANLIKAAFNNLFFLGVFWWFAWKGFTAAPVFLKQAAWVLPIYAVFLLLFGRWHEVRLWMPMYPILLPLALRSVERLFDPRAED